MLKKKISKATLVARGVFPSMIEEVFPIRLLIVFSKTRRKYMVSAIPKMTYCDVM
jgi:hypothetical protein